MARPKTERVPQAQLGFHRF